MTLDTSGVPREDRRDAVVGTLMAESTIFGFGLVFGARVIERGRAFDNR